MNEKELHELVIKKTNEKEKEHEKRRYYTSSVHFSLETMRQVNELEQIFQESRSKVISRAIENLYTTRVNALLHTPE